MNEQESGARRSPAPATADRPAAAFIYVPLLILAITAALIGASLVIKPEFVISTDQIKYLTIAKNFADGNGAHDLNESRGALAPFRIGYALFLSSVIKVFGLSGEVVVAMNYAIFFAFVGAVYFLGLRLFGMAAGALGALFLVTVPEVIAYGPRNLDALWPLLVVISALLLISRTEGERWDAAFGVLSGLIAALAALIKETSGIFMAAPVILLLLGARPPSARRVIWFYVILAAMAMFWGAYAVFLLKFSFRMLWHGADISDLPLEGNIWDYLATLAGGLVKYVHNPEAKRQTFSLTRLPLGWAMIAAFGWSVRRAVKGDPSHRTIITVFVLFLPLSAFAGAYEMRFHQNFLFLVILCVLLGAASATLWEVLKTRFPFLLKPRYLSIAVFIAGIGLGLNLMSKNAFKAAKDHFAYSSLNSHGINIIYGGNENVKALNSLPDGPVLVADFFNEMNRSVFLFGKGRPSAPLPFREYGPTETISPNPRVVFSRVFKDPVRRDNAIYIMDGEAFRKALAETNAAYVAIPGAMAPIAEWIADNIGAVKIMTFPRRNEPPDMLVILKSPGVETPRKEDAKKIYVSRSILNMLSKVNEEDPARHDEIVNWLFRREMKLESENVSELLAGRPSGQRHVIVDIPPF